MSPKTCKHYIPKLKRECKFVCYKTYEYCKRHIIEVKPFQNLERDDECKVCYEPFTDKDNPLLCGHCIHRECVIKWGKEQCPICRGNIPLTSNEIRRIKLNQEEEIENERYRDSQMTASERVRTFIDTVGVDNLFGIETNDVPRDQVQNMIRQYLFIYNMT